MTERTRVSPAHGFLHVPSLNTLSFPARSVCPPAGQTPTVTLQTVAFSQALETSMPPPLPLLLLCLVLLFSFALACPANAQVVINEVLYDPEGSDTGLEFVEILNCGREGVLMTGWVLETGNGANVNDWTVEWIGGDLDYLEAGEILLIGESDVEPSPDYVTALDLQNGPDGVRLTDGTGPVDVVGWGEPLFQEYREGMPATDVQSGLSLGRSPDCFDTDDNMHDFLAVAPTPGLRNTMGLDLSVEHRGSGPRIFAEGEEVRLECIVRNVGALPVGSLDAALELAVDGQDEPVCESYVEAPLSPRDSTAVALVWRGASPGYHRASVVLRFAGDQGTANNTDRTTFLVGVPGGLMVLNEIMHSPDENQTEWVELQNIAGETLDIGRWTLGDASDRHQVSQDSSGAALVPPSGFVILARDADALWGLASCPVLETAGWEALSSDDTVILSDEYGTPMDMLTYDRNWGGERGFSLERVRPDMPAQDPGNWGGSVSPDGCTPGRVNSIHLSAVPSPGRLTLTPNPFTPDGDGRNDRCLLRFELPVARATARVTVFDVAGRPRAVLMDHAAVASEGEFLWDGRDDGGELLPSGLYVVHLEAINSRAGVFVSDKTAVGIVR